MTKSRSLAWSSTLLSIVLAIAPGIMSLVGSGGARYDAPLAVLTATLVAIIWYTQYTFEALHFARVGPEQQRARARKSIATGLLDELRWLDGIVEQIQLSGPASLYDPLSHPMLESAFAQNAIFDADCSARISSFHALLRDLRSGVNGYRDKSSAMSPAERAELKRFLQVKAYFVLRELPVLVDALKREGGEILPKSEHATITGTALPALPPSPFGPRKSETS